MKNDALSVQVHYKKNCSKHSLLKEKQQQKRQDCLLKFKNVNETNKMKT